MQPRLSPPRSSAPMALQTYPVQGDACFTFSEPRRRLFHQAILDLPPDLHKPENAPSPKLALLGDLLPIQLRERLIAFRRYGTEPGAFLIRNLPTGASLPPTPSDGKPCSSKTSRVSEYCLLTMMLQLGEAIGYVNEKDGQLVHDVCPVRDQEQRQENTGAGDLDLHTENACHDHPPEYV